MFACLSAPQGGQARCRRWRESTAVEYTVMVTVAKYPIEAIRQLYRDRADCENGFDELKNQWGLSGFTDLPPSSRTNLK